MLLACTSQSVIGFAQVKNAVPPSGTDAKTKLITGSSDTHSFDSGWLFSRYGLQPDGTAMPEPQGLEQTNVHDASWQKVDLPHN